VSSLSHAIYIAGLSVFGGLLFIHFSHVQKGVRPFEEKDYYYLICREKLVKGFSVL
jgi:hypothetical protein